MSDKVFVDSNIFIYLITEDMTDGQVINKELVIVNIYYENNIGKYLDT